MRFGALSWRAFIHKVWLNRIWMSHWRHTMVDGAELWIGYKWPAFLSSFSCLQMIQNSAPFTIMWPQCDIRIQLWDIDIFVSILTQKIQFDFTQPFSDSLKLKCKVVSNPTNQTWLDWNVSFLKQTHMCCILVMVQSSQIFDLFIEKIMSNLEVRNSTIEPTQHSQTRYSRCNCHFQNILSHNPELMWLQE